MPHEPRELSTRQMNTSLNMKLTAESIGSLDLLLAECLSFAVTSDTTENGDQA